MTESRRVRWEGHLACMEALRNPGKCKRPFRKHMRSLKHNIKMGFKEISWERERGLNLSGSGEVPVVGTYEHDNEPSGSINGQRFY
jgi:hypothetical protein